MKIGLRQEIQDALMAPSSLTDGLIPEPMSIVVLGNRVKYSRGPDGRVRATFSFVPEED